MSRRLTKSRLTLDKVNRIMKYNNENNHELKVLFGGRLVDLCVCLCIPLSGEGQPDESDGSSRDGQEVDRGAMASSSSNT